MERLRLCRWELKMFNEREGALRGVSGKRLPGDFGSNAHSRGGDGGRCRKTMAWRFLRREDTATLRTSVTEGAEGGGSVARC